MKKCPECGLIHSDSELTCRKCHANLATGEPDRANEPAAIKPEIPNKIGRLKVRRAFILGTVLLLFVLTTQFIELFAPLNERHWLRPGSIWSDFFELAWLLGMFLPLFTMAFYFYASLLLNKATPPGSRKRSNLATLAFIISIVSTIFYLWYFVCGISNWVLDRNIHITDSQAYVYIFISIFYGLAAILLAGISLFWIPISKRKLKGYGFAIGAIVLNPLAIHRIITWITGSDFIPLP